MPTAPRKSVVQGVLTKLFNSYFPRFWPCVGIMATPVKVNDEVQSEVSSGTPKSRWEEPHHYDAVGVAVKEQRRVAASKGIMVFVLMTVAAALSSATYLVFKKHEEDNFNSTVRIGRLVH